jgi:hypothetical protein
MWAWTGRGRLAVGREHRFDGFGIFAREADQLQAGANGSQRIAQLVGQQGEEFILAAIGLPELLLRMRDGQPGAHLCGDFEEVADQAMTAIGERDTRDPPVARSRLGG